MAKPGKKQIESQEQSIDSAGSGVEEISIVGGDVGDLGGEDLTALLGDLESELTATATVAGPMPASAANTMLDDLQALDNALVDQLPVEDSRKPVEEVPAAAAAPAEPAKSTTPKRISTVGMKRSEALTKALGSRVAEYLTLNMADLSLSEAEQASKRDEFLNQLDTKTPIKIQEKVLNLFSHIAGGGNLSNYTEQAIALLAKDGELTSKTLKDAYLAHPYAEGTASSQTTQMMHLLPMVGLASRNGNKLTANPDSVLLPILTAEK